MNLSVTLKGQTHDLTLKNPVLTASGTFGYGLEFASYGDLASLGGLVTKGLSLMPRPGNPTPRIVETTAGMLNAVGLQNDGVEDFCARKLPLLPWQETAVIANIYAATVEEFSQLAARLNAEEGVAALEVNVSCPNTHVGEPFTATPEALDRLFTALDKIDRPQPTLVKMPLNKPWGEYKELLDVLAEHNVQGLSIANLQKDRTGLEIPRDWEGGLSGGPCTNASTELIRKVYKEYGDRFAIAGIGGVFTPEQAYAKIRSGSSLVMFISSLMYRGPQQITVLKRGLAQLLRRDGFEHVSDAVGVDVE